LDCARDLTLSSIEFFTTIYTGIAKPTCQEHKNVPSYW
jgi:hypothetical protein